MTGTKTLVILTVPGVGKTWYKENYNKRIAEDSPMKFPLVFDMGDYVDKPIKEQEFAFLNLIYITRKFRFDSVIMINGSRQLMNLMRYNDIPHIALLPKNRYAYTNNMDLFQNIMYMDHNSTFKKYLECKSQYLSDKISAMWDNKTVTEDSWFAYDRKEKFI